MKWCDELAIPVVTVWDLSLDNLHRNPKEMDQLIDVIPKQSGEINSGSVVA